MASLKARFDSDLKAAMLGGDKFLAEVLRSIKSAVLYEEVAKNKREAGLNDSEIEQVLAREAKKRQESADLFKQGGNQESSDKELKEKEIIERYLPKQMSDEELDELVEKTISGMGENPQMGQIIGAVKAKAGSSADGSRIAAAVKAKIS